MGKSKRNKLKWIPLELESNRHSKRVPEISNNENSKMDKCLVQDKNECEEPLKEGPKLNVGSKPEDNESNLNDHKDLTEKTERINKSINKCVNKKIEESNKNFSVNKKIKTKITSSDQNIIVCLDNGIKCENKNNDKSCDESGNNTNSKKKKSKNTSPDQKLNESVYDESKCENKSNEDVPKESNINSDLSKKKKTKGMIKLDEKSKNELDLITGCEIKAMNKNNKKSCNESDNNSNKKNKSKIKNVDNNSKCENDNVQVREESNKKSDSSKKKKTNGNNVLDEKFISSLDEEIDDKDKSIDKNIDDLSDERSGNNNSSNKQKQSKDPYKNLSKSSDLETQSENKHHNRSEGRNSKQRLSHKEQNSGRNFEKRNVHNKHRYDNYESGDQSEVSEDGDQFLEEVDEDLFMLNNEVALAHCVAEDLRMGAGIAVDFKLKFGGVGKLKDQKLKIGDVGFVKRHEQYAFYLITKSSSNSKPTMKTMEMALKSLLHKMKEFQLSKLGIPKIGCGLDGLYWYDVKSLIKEIFDGSGIHITVCIPSKILDRKAPPPLRVYMTPKNLWEMEPQTNLIIFVNLKDLSKTDFSDDVIDKVDARYPFKEKLLKDVKSKKFNSGDIQHYPIGNETIICAFFEQETFYSSVENVFFQFKSRYMAIQCKSMKSDEIVSIVLIFRSIRNNNELWLCNFCDDNSTVEHGSSYDQYFRNTRSSYSSSFSYDSYSRPDYRNTSHYNNRSYSSNNSEMNISNFHNSSMNRTSRGYFSRGQNDRNSWVSSPQNSSRGNYNPSNRTDNKYYDQQSVSWRRRSDPKCDVSSSQISFEEVNFNQLSQTDSMLNKSDRFSENKDYE